MLRFNKTHAVRYAATLLVLIALTASSQAVTINITDSHPTYTAVKTGCCPTECPECKVSAYNIQTANGNDADFTAAFNSWNNAGPKGWTLVNGGALAGTFNVTTYDAGFAGCFGGVKIRVSYVPGAGDPTGANVAWAQSIDTNAKLAGADGPGNPYLDINDSAETWDPPVYPFQYADDHFFDFPKRECPGECGALTYWEGHALLSEVDYTNKKLTVYQGIDWGFNIECTTPPPVVVTIDYTTGETTLTATVDIELVQLQLTSGSGGLLPQGLVGPGRVLDDVTASDDFVYAEGTPGMVFLPMGSTYDMGILYDAAEDSMDVAAAFFGLTGPIESEVRYVPEPMTMSVLATGALFMLVRRKRRAA